MATNFTSNGSRGGEDRSRVCSGAMEKIASAVDASCAAAVKRKRREWRRSGRGSSVRHASGWLVTGERFEH